MENYCGEIEFEFKILTGHDARLAPVGKGQNERNEDPYLPKPSVGRGFLQKFTLFNNVYEGLTGIYLKIFRTIKIAFYVLSAIILIYMVFYIINIIH